MRARANPYDFYALRYVFAGAEPVREETRKIWAERFGKRILEGYGVTECSPVIAVNTPMHFSAGTVGRFLPLIEHRLEPVPGIERRRRGCAARARMSWSGYLRPTGRAMSQAPPDGLARHRRHRHIDDDGFVTIAGRAKRFAKLGGEMVSLAAAERIAERGAIRRAARRRRAAGPRRGERLVLVTEAPGFAARR